MSELQGTLYGVHKDVVRGGMWGRPVFIHRVGLQSFKKLIALSRSLLEEEEKTLSLVSDMEGRSQVQQGGQELVSQQAPGKGQLIMVSPRC